MAKLLLGAAVVITAGILVWNLIWMQEMGNKYDVNQIREEARQLEGKKMNLTPDVAPEKKNAVPVKEEEMVRSMPQQTETQQEPMKEPLKEKKRGVTVDVGSPPEPVAEKKSEQIVQGEQEIDFVEPVEEAEILNKSINKPQPDPDQPRVITIKGNPEPKSVSRNRNVIQNINNTRTPVTDTTPVNNVTPVTQHPTSTSP